MKESKTGNPAIKTPTELLLGWYDRNHRTLPWRIGPRDRARGVRPDPYAVWLSEIMLQQTTVAVVTKRFEAFLARWPTVEALAAAKEEAVMAAWAGLGYYGRARNLHACARAVAGRGGFPETAAELIRLPGIGPYTAAAIAAIAFDEPAAAVDGNVERVMARLFAETGELPGIRKALRAHAARLTPAIRPGDYAQAAMDLGATVCTARRPACGICPLGGVCAGRREGIAESLPRKAPRKARPLRRGAVYAALSPTHVLTVRRPANGLLGGMTALPATDWTESGEETAAAPFAPPFPGDWREIGEVRHSFTHFHLRLAVFAADPEMCENGGDASGGLAEGERADGMIPLDRAEKIMPTVFAKALRLARGAGRASAAGIEVPGGAPGTRFAESNPTGPMAAVHEKEPRSQRKRS